MRVVVLLICGLLYLPVKASILVCTPKSREIERGKIVGFAYGDDHHTLYYLTSDGRKVMIAHATSGVLVGIFTNYHSNGKRVRIPWIDISEIPSVDKRFNHPSVIDFKIVYLPARYTLEPKDLGLDNRWSIYALGFDYDQHNGNYREKFWQIYAKNQMANAKKTYLASEVEKTLLASWGETSDIDYEY